MMHPIRQVLVGKQQLCRQLLEELPDWFGIPAAIDEYVATVADLPMFAVGRDGRDAGMLALRWSYDEACEIYVMAVRADSHRLGLGRALILAAEDFARSQGFKVLYVKTLGPSREDEHYARTRLFYQALGFVPMEEIDGVFDQGNPCLILVKPL